MDKSTIGLMRSQAFIDGTWVGEPTLVVTDKATGEPLARVPDLTPADAETAVIAAHRAGSDWARRLAGDRARILRRWYDLIVAHADELALLLTREQGKPLAEAKAEIAYGAGFVEFNAEEAKRVYGETIPTPRAGARMLVIKQPVGVVAAITPWNFPVAMITRKVTPALAAGCTVVVKPAEETPLCALALAALAERAGLPPGVLNVVTTSDAAGVGRVLSEHPLVRMVTFTGSTEVGKLLYKQASGTVKRLGLELGGNAPFIVFADADLDSAIAGVMASKFRNSGQTCVCANRIFVERAIYDRFAARLVAEVKKLRVGPGTESGVTQGPLINARAIEKVERHIADATAKGARVLTGGRRHALGRTFFEPTVVEGVTADMALAAEETFGPVAPLIAFADEADVIAKANDTTSGLAAYFYTRDLGRAWRVAEALEYGIVGVNEGVVSSELAPFGGIKESGLGREGGHHGIEEFLDTKYVMMGGL